MTIKDVRDAVKKIYKQLNSINVYKHDYREFYGACTKLLQIDSLLASMEESEYELDPKEIDNTYQEVMKITNSFISTDINE